MKAIFCTATLLLFSSCSSFLYYPTQVLHIEPKRFGQTPEEVWFSSADQTKLFGWLFRHPGKEKAKAVFLFYHGNGENLSSHYISLLWALPKGYDFFIFDYRGYGRSEGEPSPEGTVADGAAALHWLYAKYPDVPIVIFGQSLGGAVAMRNAIDLRSEIPFRAVVIESSFNSYQRVGRRVLARNWATWPFQWIPWLVLSDRYAPGEEISKISPVPMLVMHAEGDPVVPISCGEEIFSSAKEPKTFWKIPGEGHADALLRHGETYQKKLLDWLQQVLGSR